MRGTIKMISVLTVIGLISGISLALVYNYASPLIEKNQNKKTEQAIFTIFPEGKKYTASGIKEENVFKVTDGKGCLLGLAFLAEGNGYQGTIKIMAGIKTDLKTLIGIEILESQETPGLGQEITENNFKEQFKNLSTVPEIIYIKNVKPTKPNEIEAITGATISSRAVVAILNDEIKEINERVK